MSLVFKRSLTTLLLLAGAISPANARSRPVPQAASTAGTSGWTWLQDSPVIFCGQLGSISSCTIGAAQIAPTTAGSVWVIDVETPNNVTITSVTGGGGQWIKCPNCHAFDPSTGHSVDAIYNLTGNAGTTQGITINLSGQSGAFFNIDFVEFLPPSGATASLDASGAVFDSTCTTCQGVNLGSLSGTDIVIQTPGASAVASWNAVSAPWTVDTNGGAFNLNTTSGAAPTNTLPSPGRAPLYISLAFKSSAGIFTPPSYQNQNSIVQFDSFTATCSPTCTRTLPQATGAGHLLFVMAADLAFVHINSISGGGTWTVPSGSNTCQIQYVQAGNNAFSCGYVLSSTAGATSLSITLSGNVSTGFGIWEIASSSGLAWTLDAQASHVNAPGATPPGQALTIAGNNDVIFQGGFAPGGVSGVSVYPQTYILHSGTGYILFNEASEAMLLNSGPGPTAPMPVWIDPQTTQNTEVFGIAFTRVGTSTQPGPPTNLTATVH